MTPFTTVTARTAVLDRADVDTDQIIPARFLRKPRSVGYGTFLFHDLMAVRDAVLGAGVLFVGANFGCGSSREGAVYALVDAGVRCIVAPSFGDIFAGNAGKNGLLLVTSSLETTAAMRRTLGAGGTVTVDLPNQVIEGVAGLALPFEIEPFQKRLLTEGLDEVELTLSHAAALAEWHRHDGSERPWAVPSGR